MMEWHRVHNLFPERRTNGLEVEDCLRSAREWQAIENMEIANNPKGWRPTSIPYIVPLIRRIGAHELYPVRLIIQAV